MIRTLSPETTLEDLLLNGSNNQRMATAITAAFIETYGFAETPKSLRLADMEKISRCILLRQPNFGMRAAEQLAALCAKAGVSLLDSSS
ncbi:MAG: hypothetical protein VX124_05855 [Pseudomonadota bacterium]|nr:hypothetical protein [Pseudomonadota bacterium]